MDDAAEHLRFVHRTLDSTIQRYVAALNAAAARHETDWVEQRKQKDLNAQVRKEEKISKRRLANKARKSKKKLRKQKARQEEEDNKRAELCNKLEETTPDPEDRIITWASAITLDADPYIASELRE